MLLPDIDVKVFLEPSNKELPKGVAATFPFSVTIENIADTDIAAATGMGCQIITRSIQSSSFSYVNAPHPNTMALTCVTLTEATI